MCIDDEVALSYFFYICYFLQILHTSLALVRNSWDAVRPVASFTPDIKTHTITSVQHCEVRYAKLRLLTQQMIGFYDKHLGEWMMMVVESS